MSNKSSILEPQHHKSIQELAQEDKIRREQDRQRALFHEVILPYLKAHTTTMYEAVKLIATTNKAIEDMYREKVMVEQKRLSEAKIVELNLLDSLELKKQKDECALIELLKEETIGSLTGILMTFNKWCAVSREKEDKERSVDVFPFASLE